MKGDGKTTCQFCGGTIELQILKTGVHYAKRMCKTCGRCNGFQSKPDSDPTKYRRPPSHRELVDKFSNGFCEMCLTREADLPKGQSLEAQHVIEFTDGGPPTRENIWIVCTGCHRMIHWVRTYHGKNRFVADAVSKVAEAMSIPQ